MFWLWSGPSDSYCWFSFASAFQLFLAVESSSLFHFCIRSIFVFSEMLHSCVRNPSHGLRARVVATKNRFKSPSNLFTDRFKAVFLLWFENRIPLKPALRWGRMQPRKLQCCIWRDTIKPILRFSWICVFFVSKGNIPFFTFILLYLSLYVFACISWWNFCFG